MEKVLVAVDGSDKAYKASQKAAELTEKLGLEATLIHVYNVSDHIPINQFNEVVSYLSAETLESITEQQEDSIQQGRKNILVQNAVCFEERGLEVKKVVLQGDAANEICRYADENDFDLIIVSDKGRGKVERYLLGSTTDKIMRYCNTSVMVVK